MVSPLSPSARSLSPTSPVTNVKLSPNSIERSRISLALLQLSNMCHRQRKTDPVSSGRNSNNHFNGVNLASLGGAPGNAAGGFNNNISTAGVQTYPQQGGGVFLRPPPLPHPEDENNPLFNSSLHSQVYQQHNQYGAPAVSGSPSENVFLGTGLNKNPHSEEEDKIKIASYLLLMQKFSPRTTTPGVSPRSPAAPLNLSQNANNVMFAAATSPHHQFNQWRQSQHNQSQTQHMQYNHGISMPTQAQKFTFNGYNLTISPRENININSTMLTSGTALPTGVTSAKISGGLHSSTTTDRRKNKTTKQKKKTNGKQRKINKSRSRSSTPRNSSSSPRKRKASSSQASKNHPKSGHNANKYERMVKPVPKSPRKSGSRSKRSSSARGQKKRPSGSSGPNNDVVKCNCKNSSCLKMYCDCFAKQIFCNDCRCQNCFNTLATKKERDNAVKAILKVRPDAFTGKSVCTCTRSNCQKGYCKCFANGVGCGAHCSCINCHNNNGANPRSALKLVGTGTTAITASTKAVVINRKKLRNRASWKKPLSPTHTKNKGRRQSAPTASTFTAPTAVI